LKAAPDRAAALGSPYQQQQDAWSLSMHQSCACACFSIEWNQWIDGIRWALTDGLTWSCGLQLSASLALMRALFRSKEARAAWLPYSVFLPSFGANCSRNNQCSVVTIARWRRRSIHSEGPTAVHIPGVLHLWLLLVPLLPLGNGLIVIDEAGGVMAEMGRGGR
jgi:hypothetical protein